jgi:hypothetical protein
MSCLFEACAGHWGCVLTIRGWLAGWLLTVVAVSGRFNPFGQPEQCAVKNLSQWEVCEKGDEPETAECLMTGVQ